MSRGSQLANTVVDKLVVWVGKDNDSFSEFRRDVSIKMVSCYDEVGIS
jgi:tryptophanyl-tRNA synthetase